MVFGVRQVHEGRREDRDWKLPPPLEEVVGKHGGNPTPSETERGPRLERGQRTL